MVTRRCTAPGFRSGSNLLNAASSQSFAWFGYVAIPTAATATRRVWCIASSGWQVRLTTSGTLQGVWNASVTSGSQNHVNVGVFPIIYYRNVATTTVGVMTLSEHFTGTYTTAATTNLSNHGPGAENGNTSCEGRYGNMFLFLGTSAETLAQRSSLVKLGWSPSW